MKLSERYGEEKGYLCSISVSSSTTRPKTSAVLVSGSMIRGLIDVPLRTVT